PSVQLSSPIINEMAIYEKLNKTCMCASSTNSIVIVEKVVNEPIQPTVKPVANTVCSFCLSAKTLKINVNKKQPIIFARNVPIGKIVYVSKRRDKANRKVAPTIPPKPTTKINVIWCFFMHFDKWDRVHIFQICDQVPYILLNVGRYHSWDKH